MGFRGYSTHSRCHDVVSQKSGLTYWLFAISQYLPCLLVSLARNYILLCVSARPSRLGARPVGVKVHKASSRQANGYGLPGESGIGLAR